MLFVQGLDTGRERDTFEYTVNAISTDAVYMTLQDSIMLVLDT